MQTTNKSRTPAKKQTPATSTTTLRNPKHRTNLPYIWHSQLPIPRTRRVNLILPIIADASRTIHSPHQRLARIDHKQIRQPKIQSDISKLVDKSVADRIPVLRRNLITSVNKMSSAVFASR